MNGVLKTRDVTRFYCTCCTLQVTPLWGKFSLLIVAYSLLLKAKTVLCPQSNSIQLQFFKQHFSIQPNPVIHLCIKNVNIRNMEMKSNSLR